MSAAETRSDGSDCAAIARPLIADVRFLRKNLGIVETEPPAMKAGSTLRFRVEDPTRGIESSTWSLVGSKKSGDLYFGGREIMGDLKLSLHGSGITRMAWTEAVAGSRVAPDADRVLSRWTAVESLPNGWVLALRLSIPDSALSPILPPLPEGPSKPTVTLPAAGPGRTVEVRVLLGRPGCGDIRLEGELEEVGRMVLGDGTKVFVTAWSHPATAATEAQLSKVRARALAEGAAERPTPRAFGWGYEDGSDIPFVLDAGDPRPQEDRPTVIPRYDGPSSVVVGEVRPEPSEGRHPGL
jgi:hypothetical protein